MPGDRRSAPEEPEVSSPITDEQVLGILARIWALHHGLQAVSKRMQRRLGVTAPQRAVLRTVQHASGISAGDLARRLHEHPSTLTGVLRRLEQGALLVREGDPDDKRRALFRITDKGRALCGEQEGTVEAAIRRALARLGPEERAALDRALTVVAEELLRTPTRTP